MTLQEIKERMHGGRLYICADEDLMKEQTNCLYKMYEYNSLLPNDGERKQQLMKEMFAEVGEGCYIEVPFRANWGGKHVHLGSNVYANFNLTMVDDTHIYIEDNVMIAPNVVLCTGTHPISPSLRVKQAQYNKPIRICKNVWLGAGVLVMPGVTIGENSVIGAGSVVTKDIPANVVAYGVPCKIVREITSRDDEIFDNGQPIDIW